MITPFVKQKRRGAPFVKQKKKTCEEEEKVFCFLTPSQRGQFRSAPDQGPEAAGGAEEQDGKMRRFLLACRALPAVPPLLEASSLS